MNKILVYVMLASLAFIQSCKNDDPTCTKEVAADKISKVDQTRLTNDIAAIDAYLSANGIVAQQEPNGVRYVVSKQGDADTPCLESRITVKYKGNLLSNPTGTPFDQTTSNVRFLLSGLILGWQLVLPSIQAGSTVTLYIPSGYAYGSTVAAGGKIPANANLIFEIELVAAN